MKQLTMAVIGFGKSATRYHLPYLLSRPDIRVKYVIYFGRDANREAGYAKSHINFSENIQDALDDPEVQLLTLSTPPSTHYSLAKQAIVAGKNVLVEKPFCETLAQTEEVLRLAKGSGLMAMPYQNRRFDSDYLTLKNVLKRGYVGRAFQLESHWDKFRPDDQEKHGIPLSGALYSMGIHMVDQVVSLFGRPDTVEVNLRAVQNLSSTLDDTYFLALNYDHVRALVTGCPLIATPYPRFILNGTDGAYSKYDVDQQENDLKLGIMPGDSGFGADQSDKFGTVRYRNSGGDWIEKKIPSERGDYGQVYTSVRETILHGGEKLVSDNEALTDIEILEKAVAQPDPHVIEL